jgi:hypothetical protein
MASNRHRGTACLDALLPLRRSRHSEQRLRQPYRQLNANWASLGGFVNLQMIGQVRSSP